jgi:hypothetical protein
MCRVDTPQKFLGAVHARDYRRAACTSYGLGGTTTELNINMLVEKNSDSYCGVFINEVRIQCFFVFFSGQISFFFIIHFSYCDGIVFYLMIMSLKVVDNEKKRGVKRLATGRR